MFTNCEGCTIYHKTVGTDRLPAWERHVIKNIYWEETSGQAVSGKSMEQSSSIYIGIPATSVADYIPQKDDTVVKGITDAPYGELSEKHIVMAVADLRYGSAAVQHIEVDAQ